MTYESWLLLIQSTILSTQIFFLYRGLKFGEFNIFPFLLLILSYFLNLLIHYEIGKIASIIQNPYFTPAASTLISTSNYVLFFNMVMTIAYLIFMIVISSYKKVREAARSKR